MSDLVKCKALVEFVEAVPDYGMIVGAPGSTEDAAKNPLVPAAVVDRLVAEGKVELTGKAKAKPAAEAAPAADEAP